MKRTLLFILTVLMMFSFYACDSDKDVKTLEATRESVDNWLLNIVYKETETFFKACNEDAQQQGCIDYLNKADENFSQLNLSNIGYVFENASETDETGKYSYDASTYDQTYYIYFDGTSKNIAMELQGEDTLTLLEVKELSDGRYVMQYYEKVDGRYNVSRLVFKGKTGSLSYSYDLKVRPTRIYSETDLPADYATQGDDVFTLTDGKLAYTTTREKLSDMQSVIDWIDGTVIKSAEEYYDANKEAAADLGEGDRFKEYMTGFDVKDIPGDIKTAMENGENTSGVYSYSNGDQKIIVAYDGSSKNIQLRSSKGNDYYVFEVRELGKKKYSINYYTNNSEGLYNAYRIVFRTDGNCTAAGFVNLTDKPTLVYNKIDNEVGSTWASTGCNYYFTVLDGEMKFIDVAKQEQERLESEAAAAEALDSEA